MVLYQILEHRAHAFQTLFDGQRQVLWFAAEIGAAVNDHLGIEPPGGSYPEVLPLACTATKRRDGDIRMAVAMQKLESGHLTEDQFARAWTGETRPYSQSLGHLKDGS